MKRKFLALCSLVVAELLIPGLASASTAGDAAAINTGDTAFMFVATGLVFLMTPGLALFYGGMVRKKNVLNTMLCSFVLIGLVTIQWVLFGYSLAFGADAFGGLIGGLEYLGFSGVGGAPCAYAATIPQGLFAMYQLMFAIITPAIITGAFVERFRFPVYMAFALIWTTLVYDPLAHWVWGAGGWLMEMGALDFAGGTVVHVSSGVAGLVAVLVIGKRKDYKLIPMFPHNTPFIMLGAAMLWFGWFGFNAGSALGLSTSSLAVIAFITTNVSAAAAMLSWLAVEWIHNKKPTLLGASTGAIVGLVAITPAAGFVSVASAIAIGLITAPLCYFGISFLKVRLGYDDSLDAFGCHGIGGIWGAMATGLFCDPAINSAVKHSGLFLGGGLHQLGVQLLSVVVTLALSGVVTFGALKLIARVTALRVSANDEIMGLDISVHGEDAYRDLVTE
ncbi:MAG: ammonium transporter [Negativicutes bacterium]|jgi:Amt family ammonium transporter